MITLDRERQKLIKGTRATAFGEVLFDRYEDPNGKVIEKRFGGAPGNMAADLAALGANVSMVGVLSKDENGQMLVDILKERGVNTDNLVQSDKFKTPVAIVRVEGGDRHFDRFDPTLQVIPHDIVVPKTDILIFGSLSQIDSESAAATQHALSSVRKGRNNRSKVWYDPNFREALWTDEGRARKTILETLPEVDIVKINEKELELLTGQTDPRKGADQLFYNHDAIFITLGENGVYFKTRKIQDHREGYRIKNSIDSTGAGDAFGAAMIFSLIETGLSFSEMSEPQFHYYLDRAQKMAALTTTQKGAIEAFPTLADLEKHSWKRRG